MPNTNSDLNDADELAEMLHDMSGTDIAHLKIDEVANLARAYRALQSQLAEAHKVLADENRTSNYLLTRASEQRARADRAEAELHRVYAEMKERRDDAVRADAALSASEAAYVKLGQHNARLEVDLASIQVELAGLDSARERMRAALVVARQFIVEHRQSHIGTHTDKVIRCVDNALAAAPEEKARVIQPVSQKCGGCGEVLPHHLPGCLNSCPTL